MKWIGQHIYDLVSRFRDDVYLEDISSGTIASGGNLGLDSNNKIVKQSDTGITDLHGAGVDGSNNQLLTDDGDGTVTSEANLTFDGSTLSVEADANTTANALFIDANSLTTGGAIKIDVDDALTASATKSLVVIDYDKAGVTASGQTSKTTGLNIQMHDAATNHASGITQTEGVVVVLDAASDQGTIRQTGYQAYLTDADVGTSVGYYSFVEDGGVDFKAVSSAPLTADYFTMQTGASGATTLTTVDAAATAAHFEIAADGNITLDAEGDIALEAGGSDISIVASDLTMYDAVNDGNPTISLGSSATNRLEIKTGYNSGAQTLDEVYFNSYTTSGTTNDGRYIFQVDEVEIGRFLDAGISWQGAISCKTGLSDTNATASSATEGGKLQLRADDGAAMGDDHRLGVIEFLGAEDASNTRTIGARIEAMCDAAWSASENGGRLDFYTTDGNASESKVLTLDSDKLATFSGGVTVAGDLTVNGDNITFESANADDPVVTIKNTANDNQAARLVFWKDRGAAMADNDRIAEIEFFGEDASENLQGYGKIMCQALESDHGVETGSVKMLVAEYDGTLTNGLQVWGGTADGVVNVTLGAGAASTTTIAGDLAITTGLILDSVDVTAIQTATEVASSFGDNDTSLLTAAAIDDRIRVTRKHVLRCNAFYVNDTPFVQNSLYFGNAIGNNPYNWNDPAAAGGAISSTSSFTIIGDDENWGIVLPVDISKIEIQCSLRPSLGQGDDFSLAVYTGVRSDDSSAALTLTKVGHQSVAFSSTNQNYTRNDLTGDDAIVGNYDAGTMIYVGVGSEDATNAKQARGYMNITVTER